jgi:hypothetical protein
MAIYKLWREADNQDFDCEAVGAEAALVSLGRELGQWLTFLPVPGATTYLLSLGVGDKSDSIRVWALPKAPD